MNTPITDRTVARVEEAIAWHGGKWGTVVPAELARRLERDRAELVEMMKKLCAPAYRDAGHAVPPLSVVSEARALLARIEADK